MEKKFSLSSRLKSFKFAFAGLYCLFKNEHNARIHLLAILIVTALAFLLEISKIEWCIIIIAMVLVVAAEGFNTAIEAVCDLASPNEHPLVKKSKDVAAGAVLFSAIGAAIIGAIIFLPYLL